MKPLRILLADDSAFAAQRIADQLKDNGHQVTLAHSGEAALEAYLNNRPEVVLMDLEMPGMGGLEAIRQIRKLPATTRVPIIVITGHQDEASLLESFLAGADDFLSKPVEPLLLDIRIQTMMRIVGVQRTLAATVDSMIEAVIRIDRVGRITAFNKAAETIFGYATQEVLGNNVSMLMPSPYREQHDQYIGNYHATGERKILGNGREVTGLRKNGETFPMHLGVTEVETPDESFFVGVVRDLTEENALRKHLAESRNFLASVIEHIPAATYVKSRRGKYVLVNKKWEELTRMQRSQVVGKTDSELFAPDEAEAFRRVDLDVMDNGRVVEAEETLKDSQAVKTFLSVKFPTRNVQGEVTGICGISTDITPIKEYQMRLEQLSQQDELTHLHNRRHFLELARRAFERPGNAESPLSLLMIDIDHFKRINDGLGHKMGDLVLAGFGQHLTGELRESDIAGRIGGEEFAVLLPDTSPDAALRAAERLCQSWAEKPITLSDDQMLRSTLSIGVATRGGPIRSLEDLMHEADIALYAAKNAGRNRVTFAGSSPA